MKVTDRWYSDRLGQDISVARWGSYGAPVLLFPTAGGDAEEVERHHMISHLEPLIAAGRAKVYSVDSIAGRALAERRGSADYRLAPFNALAITCRYPELVQSAVCMSGTYAIEQFIGGHVNDDLYFSSPLRFLPD